MTKTVLKGPFVKDGSFTCQIKCTVCDSILEIIESDVYIEPFHNCINYDKDSHKVICDVCTFDTPINAKTIVKTEESDGNINVTHIKDNHYPIPGFVSTRILFRPGSLMTTKHCNECHEDVIFTENDMFRCTNATIDVNVYGKCSKNHKVVLYKETNFPTEVINRIPVQIYDGTEKNVKKEKNIRQCDVDTFCTIL